VQGRRIERAKELLRNLELPVVDVALSSKGEASVILRVKPTHVFERGTEGQRASRWS
jgi:hypothetical protein